MLWVKLVIILFSEANCCLRCRFPRLYRPSWRVKGDELHNMVRRRRGHHPFIHLQPCTRQLNMFCTLQRPWPSEHQSCCWNFDMGTWRTWRSRHLDVMSRSTDQLKGTIISFQSLQTSFRSFPNTQESILCYSMYVLQLTNLYTLYDTLIPYAYVLAGTVSCSASTYSQCSKFQRNFAKFADFGPLRNLKILKIII